MPSGAKNVVVGFNHNLKYRGLTYHAQTEDLGPPRCQVVTHLFLGGNVVASKRTSYADLPASEGLHEAVRAMMEAQHKEVLRDLVHGKYDQPGAAGAPPPAPLFGEGWLSRRRLDEVVLDWLARAGGQGS